MMSSPVAMRLFKKLPVLLLMILFVASTALSLMGQLAIFAGEWTGTWSDEFGSGGISFDFANDGDDVSALAYCTESSRR